MASTALYDKYMHDLLGHNPADYEVLQLETRYEAMLPILVQIVAEVPASDTAYSAKEYLASKCGVQVGSKSSPLIEKLIASVKSGKDPGAAAKVKALLDTAHSHMLYWNQEQAKATRGPTAMESGVAAADMSLDDIRKAAKIAELKFVALMTNFDEFCAAVGPLIILKDLGRAIHHAIQVFGDGEKLAASMPEQEAAMAASAVLGPLGIGGAILLQLTAVTTFLLEFIAVVDEMAELLNWLVTGKRQVTPEMKAILDKGASLNETAARVAKVMQFLAKEKGSFGYLAKAGSAARILLHGN